MASANKLSYERESIVKNVLINSWGYDTVQFFDAKDTECFIAESDTHALLAFRGTKGLGDWIGNMKVISTNEPSYGAVHKGFFDDYHDVSAQLLPLLLSWQADMVDWA